MKHDAFIMDLFVPPKSGKAEAKATTKRIAHYEDYAVVQGIEGGKPALPPPCHMLGGSAMMLPLSGR